MAVPWIGILDAAIGMANMALARRAKSVTDQGEARQTLAKGGPSGASGALEAHFAGVVIAALKEVFDRDSRRLDLEREQAEADRKRAERALRLELLRQAGDREIGRLRLIAAVAVVIWLATLWLVARFVGGSVAARVILGLGWAALLGALSSALVGLSSVGRALANPDLGRDGSLEPGPAGIVAAWLLIGGLGLIGAAVLFA